MIPKFDPYHLDLHSSFVSFERYKLFLQNKHFSGYIKLENNQTECFFFIKEGNDISSFFISDNVIKQCNSLEEVQSILRPPFIISSYRTLTQVVDFFSRSHAAKLTHNNIAFHSIELDKFLSQIDSKKITGFLEVIKPNEPAKYIYFYNGKIFGYMNIKGKEGLFEKNLDKAQIQSGLQNSTMNIYVFQSINPAAYTSQTQKNSAAKKPPASNSASLNTNDISLKTDGSNDNERVVMLKCYEEIFQMLEKSNGSAEFSSIWRALALELSNKYIFLNPFAGEFNYEMGKIDLWEKIDIKTAINALDDLVNSIAKKANLPKDGIKSIKDNYLNMLAAYEIRS